MAESIIIITPNKKSNIFRKINSYYLFKLKQKKLDKDTLRYLKLHTKFNKDLPKILQLNLNKKT